MIRFSCTCNRVFETPEDQAGTSFQCPTCGRLVDVPTLTELQTLDRDGTYKLDAPPSVHTPEDEQKRVAELHRFFTRDHVDKLGREIDLRPTMEDVELAGVTEVPLELKDEVMPGAPRYDPVTGELVRPLDVKGDETGTPHGLPWQKPQFHPLSENQLPFTSLMIIPSLFGLSNIAVMFAVFCMHFIMLLMLFPLSLKFLILAPFYLMIIFGLFAHYANIVDEIGPTGSDELPRPLRDLNWLEDLWNPFSSFMLALIISYGVAGAVFYVPAEARLVFLGAVWGIGSLVFPALLLTATTSGTMLNLRPDRILAVMTRCGFAYAMIVLAWIVIAPLYLASYLTSSVTFLHYFLHDMVIPWWMQGLITFPALIVSIWLMHALMWYLGMQYRYHHFEFPWVYQSHTRDPNAPPRRGFEVKRQRPAVRPLPVQSIPIPAVRPLRPTNPSPPAEIAADIDARRQRMQHQNGVQNPPQTQPGSGNIGGL